MKLLFSYTEGILNLPNQVTSCLAKADKLSICALLYLSKYPDYDKASLCAKMRTDGVLCSEVQLERALHFWYQNGLLRTCDESLASPIPSKRSLSLPVYESEELAQKLTEGESRLGMLADECQHLAQKMFTPTDLSRLVSLVDFLGLSCEYVKTLYAYCVEKGKSNLGYLQKTAQNLYEEGVRTEFDLQHYLAKKAKTESLEGKLRTLFGLGERSFTTKEKTFISAWTEADYPLELIQFAYDLTVDATGKVSFAYTDKILQSWTQNGISNLEDAKAAQKAHAQKKSTETVKDKSFQTDEFFAAALKRSYQKSQKTEGEKA